MVPWYALQQEQLNVNQKSTAFILFVYIKCTHELKWHTKTLWPNGKNASIINSMPSQTFNLVYTDIS